MQDNPVVLCDANVLYSQWLRDLVMWLGIAGLIQPRWSERIEREWIENLLGHRPDLERARIERTALMMNQALPQANVLVAVGGPDFKLPDSDDVHVLQAAVTAKARILLTFNLSDFPAEACEAAGVTAVHPDVFLVRLMEEHPLELEQVLLKLQAQKKKPPVSWTEMAQAFGRARLPEFMTLLGSG